MTTHLEHVRPADPSTSQDHRRAVLPVAFALGVGWGVLDLLVQVGVHGPWLMLANSGAWWALAAFGFGVWTRSAGVRTALGGAVMLVAAVFSFYLAAAVVRGDAIAAVWAPWSLAWAAAGVVAGSVFAVVGGLRGRGPWWCASAATAVAGVCLAVGVSSLVRPNGQLTVDTDSLVVAGILAVTGLVALVATARSVPVVLRALLLLIPGAVVVYLAVTLASLAGALA